MSGEILSQVFQGLTLVALALAIIFVLGIVWRVEFELDSSYKFFAAAVIFLFFAEVANRVTLPEYRVWALLTGDVLKAAFAICFLIGALYMRDIVRKIDGEKDGR